MNEYEKQLLDATIDDFGSNVEYYINDSVAKGKPQPKTELLFAVFDVDGQKKDLIYDKIIQLLENEHIDFFSYTVI